MKKADVAEHLKVFCHVGLLVNEPSGRTSLLFNQSSGEFGARRGRLSCFNQIPEMKVTKLALRTIARNVERPYTVRRELETQLREFSEIPPLATMSFATGRALATVVDPDEARRRDNREFRVRLDRKVDAGAATLSRATCRDGDFETGGGARSGRQNWR